VLRDCAVVLIGTLSPSPHCSGILECPCTTRKIKVLDAYKLASTSRCGMAVETPSECGSAAEALGLQMMTAVTNKSDASTPAGCSAIVSATGQWSAVFNTDATASGTCATAAANTVALAGAATVGGVAVTLQIDPSNQSVTLTVSCASAGAWFGVGLNQSSMVGAYALVVDGAGEVTEHSLGMHAAGSQLPSTVTIVSNTVAGTARTVVISLPVGARAASVAPDWTAMQEGGFPIITAIGSTPKFSYHKTHSTGEVAVGVVGEPSCLCRDPTANAGTIGGSRFNPGVCAAYPTSELLNTTYGGAINPICNISACELALCTVLAL
jgi:hypothetical protein